MVNFNKKLIFLFVTFSISSLIIIFVFGYLPIRRSSSFYYNADSSSSSKTLSIEIVIGPPYFMTTGDDVMIVLELINDGEYIITNGYANITIFLNDNKIKTIDFLNETFYYKADLQLENKGIYSFIIEATWNGYYTCKYISNAVVFSFPSQLINIAYMIICFIFILIVLSIISKLKIIQDNTLKMNDVNSIISLVFTMILFSIFISDYIGILLGGLICFVGILAWIYCKAERKKVKRRLFYSISAFMSSLTIIFIISISFNMNPLTLNNYMSYIWMIALYSIPTTSIAIMTEIAFKYRKRSKDTELRQNM